MKQKKLFLAIVFLLFSSCTSARVNTSETTAPPATILPSATVQPTATIPPTTELPATVTSTPDIAALKTQGVADPWIVTTLGTKIPPPWYSQKVLFSPDERFLVSTHSNKISLWKVDSFNKLSEFTYLNEDYGADRLAFSSDGSYLAVITSHYDDVNSHIFVWNTSSMEQVYSMDLDQVVLAKDSKFPYVYPAIAIAFIPNSTRLVTANGNSIEIIDIENPSELETIKLGQDMYASDISFPNDGRFIYVFMDWWKDNGITSYPPRYSKKHVAQIWDTNAHFLWRTLNFPEVGWAEEYKSLHGPYLVTKNSVQGTHEMMSLENEEVKQLPYRDGWSYITTDNKFVLFSRYFGVHDKEEQGIEFWTTDSWRMLYKFQPEFYDYPDKQYPLGSDPGEIAVSNDNSFLAIAYAGQVIIYDLRILTSP